MKFFVRLEQGEDGYILAECPALPGCVSQGRTEEEALRGILAVRRRHGIPLPKEEVVEVEVPA